MVVIAFSGTQLAKYGDVLAEKTGLGRTWLGLAGLAVVTSLPELITGSSAVLWVGEPDIAVGDLLGACLLNLLILAVADLFHPPGPVLTAAARGHIMAASFGLVLLSTAGLGLNVRPPAGVLSFGHIGLSTPVLLLCYFLAMQATYRYHRRERQEYIAEEEKAQIYPHIGLKEAGWKFAMHALVVVAVATWLPRVAYQLASLMGWHLSLVGTIFVALVTTAPEFMVTLGALRLGAVDLAIGDLLGSILVNVAMLGIMDVLYVGGPILRAVAPQHAGTALMAILMTSIAVAEMIYRPQKKMMRYLSLGAFLLAFLYALNIYLQVMAQGS
jgi:cation:H+ antiporter